MFQAVKTKINNFFSPIHESSEVEKGRNRKRSFMYESDLKPPKKRNKSNNSTISNWSWRTISELYNYVRSGNIPTQTQHTLPHNKKDDTKHADRSTLSATRRMISSKCSQLSQTSNATTTTNNDLDTQQISPTAGTRKPFTQISKSAILDLTIDSDDESGSFNKTEAVGGNPTNGKICVENRITRSKSTEFLDENIRLSERKRYQDLIAQFTTEKLPEYSESLSPCDSSKVNAIALQPSTPIQKGKKSFKSNLTKIVNNHSPRREFFHTVLNDTKSKPFCDYSQSQSEGNSATRFNRSEANSATRLNRSSKSCSTLNPHLSLDASNIISVTPSVNKINTHTNLWSSEWIKKWRDTLEPLQLERDRQIRETERKRDKAKEQQLADFKRVQDAYQKSKFDEFPELTNEILSIVNKALSSGQPNEVLAEGFNTEITRQDLSTLKEATWLNDEVVNFYFNLLKERSENDATFPKIHVFNTFFYPKIVKTGHSGVKRWTRKVDIFACDVVLIPVHLGMHWCLAVIDFRNKELVYYDSLKGNNSQCLQHLRKYIQDESQDKKKTQFDFSDWSDAMPKDIPEQMNGCDCGVFMCKYAEYQSRCAPFTFTQKHMSYFRKRMVYEIVSKKLM